MKSKAEIEHVIQQVQSIKAKAKGEGDMIILSAIVGMVTALSWVIDNDNNGFAEMVAAMDAVDRAERQ